MITGEVKIMAASDNCFVDMGFSLGGDSFLLIRTSVLSPAKSCYKMCLSVPEFSSQEAQCFQGFLLLP